MAVANPPAQRLRQESARFLVLGQYRKATELLAARFPGLDICVFGDRPSPSPAKLKLAPQTSNHHDPVCHS